MAAAAPRIPPRLRRAIRKIDDGEIPVAEVSRRAGVIAERFGLKRPSYEQVRVIVNAHRALRRRRRATAHVGMEVVMRVKPPEALLDHVAGTGDRPD